MNILLKIMASTNITFGDIRLILCVQGYSLDYQFIVREIGFWCNGLSGSIPFNCKINRNQLDVKNQKTLYALEELIHGINLKNVIKFGLAQSETRAVLRTLYHMAGNGSESKYIGICRDENINGLLYKAGLGSFVIDIDNLEMFQHSEVKCPSNKDLQTVMQNDPVLYAPCHLHDNLMSDDKPLCAKVKAQYIADFCKNYTIVYNETNNKM